MTLTAAQYVEDSVLSIVMGHLMQGLHPLCPQWQARPEPSLFAASGCGQQQQSPHSGASWPHLEHILLGCTLSKLQQYLCQGSLPMLPSVDACMEFSNAICLHSVFTACNYRESWL